MIKTGRNTAFFVEETGREHPTLPPVRIAVEHSLDGVKTGPFTLFDFLTVDEAISLGNLLLTVAHEVGTAQEAVA